MHFYVPAKQTSYSYSDTGLTTFVVRLFNTNRKLIRNGKKRRTKDSWTLYMQSTSNVPYDELVYSFHNISSKNSRDQINNRGIQWNNALDTQQEIRVIALDISKAFDHVWHKGLMEKLSSFGIQGDLHCCIASFLSARQQYFVLDGSTSSTKPISAEVPTGSILDYVIFFMFIDNLASHLQNDIHLFADDSTLHIAIKNTCDRIIRAESL